MLRCSGKYKGQREISNTGAGAKELIPCGIFTCIPELQHTMLRDTNLFTLQGKLKLQYTVQPSATQSLLLIQNSSTSQKIMALAEDNMVHLA